LRRDGLSGSPPACPIQVTPPIGGRLFYFERADVYYLPTCSFPFSIDARCLSRRPPLQSSARSAYRYRLSSPRSRITFLYHLPFWQFVSLISLALPSPEVDVRRSWDRVGRRLPASARASKGGFALFFTWHADCRGLCSSSQGLLCERHTSVFPLHGLLMNAPFPHKIRSSTLTSRKRQRLSRPSVLRSVSRSFFPSLSLQSLPDDRSPQN